MVFIMRRKMTTHRTAIGTLSSQSCFSRVNKIGLKFLKTIQLADYNNLVQFNIQGILRVQRRNKTNRNSSFRNDSKEQTNSSLVANEDMSDLEVEFTPNLTWKCKTKSKRSDVSNPSEPNSAIKGIATPVIKSLESVRSNWKLPAQRDD